MAEGVGVNQNSTANTMSDWKSCGVIGKSPLEVELGVLLTYN